MSGDKWYPIDLHGYRETAGDGVTIVLSSGDVPVEFAVDVINDEAICIKMRYLYPTDEPTQTSRLEGVDFTMGRYSHRLFSIKLDVDVAGARSRREVEDKIRRALWRAFANLRQRTRLGGPRMNYLAASEGLGIEAAEGQTPRWMADALERMRLEHSGSHSR